MIGNNYSILCLNNLVADTVNSIPQCVVFEKNSVDLKLFFKCSSALIGEKGSVESLCWIGRPYAPDGEAEQHSVTEPPKAERLVSMRSSTNTIASDDRGIDKGTL